MADHPRPSTRGMSRADLIGHILSHYHEGHRRALPELIALAAEVERHNALHPQVPHGLGDALTLLRLELEDHMRREERELFPALLAGAAPAAGQLAAALQHDHDFQDEAIEMIAEMTGHFRPPADASLAWRRLYAGTASFLHDLLEHTRLENEELLRPGRIAA